MRIYLMGIVGAGKSTVGSEVASRLGYPFIDAGNIADSFAKDGRGGHYDCANRALLSAAIGMADLVVACGGYQDAASIAHTELGSRDAVRRYKTVWIDVDPGVAWDRLQVRGWGIRKPQDREKFWISMNSLGSRYLPSDIRVDGGGEIWEVAQKVIDEAGRVR